MRSCAYYLLPRKQPLCGLYTGLGVGFTYESFWRTYTATPGEADGLVDIHTPMSFHLGHQGRIGQRVVVSFSWGCAVSGNHDAPTDTNRPWSFMTAAQVSLSQGLHVGYRF